jgi:curved DNA-binding protein CbpA
MQTVGSGVPTHPLVWRRSKEFATGRKKDGARPMDPHDVLNLPRNHTLEQLRYNYKVLARQLHPDKRGDSLTKEQANTAFQVLTDAYRTLTERHRASESDKTFDAMRGGSRDELGRQARRNAVNTDLVVDRADPAKGFSLDRFNRVYEEHRSEDAERDGGYGSWMSRHDPNDPKDLSRNRQMVRYTEPEPVSLSRRGCVQFTELGLAKISDYSRGDDAKHGLQYTDYRVAHTTTKLVDERALDDRKQFRSIDELKAHRSAVHSAMTDAEAAAAAEAEIRRKKEIAKRDRLQQERDAQLERHFHRVHKSLLGYTTSTF